MAADTCRRRLFFFRARLEMRIGKAEREARAELLRWTFGVCGKPALLETKGLLEMALDVVSWLTFPELDAACSSVAARPPHGPIISEICARARAQGGEDVRRREAADSARRLARAGLKKPKGDAR